jgi:hypothetical protein
MIMQVVVANAMLPQFDTVRDYIFMSCLPNDSTKHSFKLQNRANKDGVPLHIDNSFRDC